MKILQHKIVQAFKASEKVIDNENLPNDVLWKIYKIRHIMMPSIEFQDVRENAIRNKYAAYLNNKGELAGALYNEYLNELRELGNMEVDVELERRVRIEYKPEYGFTIREIEALEDFIDFDLERVCKSDE